MDVTEFIEQCAGKWFSQRTSHAIPPQPLEAGTSNLWIEVLASDDKTALQRCQNLNLDPQTLRCAIRTRWEGTVGTAASPDRGSTLTIFVSPDANPKQGQFWRWAESSEEAVTGQYSLGEDEALTLLAQGKQFSAEERLWFVSENLRERTSVVSQANGDRHASFCSEIRMGLK